MGNVCSSMPKGRLRVLGIAAIVTLAAACGTSTGEAADETEAGSVDGSATCREYLGWGDEDRGIAVRTIGTDLGWGDAGNPMSRLGVDSHCSQRPDQTLDQAIGLFADSSNRSNQDQSEADTQATSAATSSPTTQVSQDASATSSVAAARPQERRMLIERDPLYDFCSIAAFDPLVVDDVVLFGCGEEILAFDLLTNAAKWSIGLGDDTRFQGSFVQTPNGAAFLAYQDVEASGLTAGSEQVDAVEIDASDGSVLWRHKVADDRLNASRIQVSGSGHVVLATFIDRVNAMAVYRDGQLLWESERPASDVLIGRDVVAYEYSGVIQGIHDLNSGDLLWTPEGSHWYSFDASSPYIASVSDRQLLDQATGEVVADLDLDPKESRGMRRPGPDGVLMSTSAGLQQAGADGAIQWTIPSEVYSKFAVYGQSLVVINTAGEIIDVDRATGTELGRLSEQPEDRFPGWDWYVEHNFDEGRVWIFRPVGS